MWESLKLELAAKIVAALIEKTNRGETQWLEWEPEDWYSTIGAFSVNLYSVIGNDFNIFISAEPWEESITLGEDESLHLPDLAVAIKRSDVLDATQDLEVDEIWRLLADALADPGNGLQLPLPEPEEILTETPVLEW
jgi:hypothetical protein